MDVNEREAYAFYAGEIWCRSVLQIPADCRTRCSISVGSARRKCGGNDPLRDRMDPDHLLLFQDVFTEYFQALCRESGVPCEDIRDPRFLPETEEYMEAEERLSYLYMSRLQAEDPHSERKRPDRDPVSQVRKDVYKEKLTGVVP